MSTGDLERIFTRRRFLLGIGIGLGAVVAETGLRRAISSLLPAEPVPAEPRAMTGGATKIWNPDPYVTPERLAPRTLPARGAQPALRATFRRPALRTKIGQMLLIGFRGTGILPSSPVMRAITGDNVGGVLLFDRRNIASPGQLKALVAGLQQAALKSGPRSPLIVAVDQEGGSVARLNPRNGFPATPTAASLGARNDPSYTRSVAAGIGRTLASMGINLDLAPVVDVNVNPSNPAIGRNGRSFSASPAVVSAQGAAFVDGLHDAGVRASLKHFPGQGSATGDTHLGVVDVTRRWTDAELAPFANLIASGRADTIMTGHIFNSRLDPDHPATLSKPTITGLLRGRLGFGGVVISDDLQMGAISDAYGWDEAVRLAVVAGVDLLMIADPPTRGGSLVRRTIDLIEDLVAAGRISESRINESYDRIQAFKATLLSGAA